MNNDTIKTAEQEAKRFLARIKAFRKAEKDMHYEGETEVLPHMFARGVRVQLWHLVAAQVCVEVNPRPRIINEIITNFLTMAIIRCLAKEKK